MEQDKIFFAVNTMVHTHIMHKQLIDSRVASIGLHRTQHRILMHISENNRLDSQKALAEHIRVTPPAITGALKKLEGSGYIKKIQGSDNRYNSVEITESGKEIIEKTKALFSETDKILFEGFTEEEIDCYLSCLEKIQKNINSSLKNIDKEQK